MDRPDTAGAAESPDRPIRATDILAAALERFAAYGLEATSLRDIAREAGVSIGLIQHHFGHKRKLVEAVDQHVLRVLRAAVVGPLTQQFGNPASEQGHRVVNLVTDHSIEVQYLARAFADGRELSSQVFDLLAEQGIARWHDYEAQGLTKPDTDATWAALNLVLIFLGAVTMRSHLDRHLPAPLTTPEQLHRWETSVNRTINDGMLK